MLKSEDDDFIGWKIGPGLVPNANILPYYCLPYCLYLSLRITFKSTANQGVVNRLVREVKGLNPEFKTEQIQGKNAVIHVL